MFPCTDFWYGGFWPFPILMLCIFAIVAFVFCIAGWRDDIRSFCNPFKSNQHKLRNVESSLEIAKRRYVTGEISKEEFEEIRKSISEE